jgi:hypothetical protein
MLIAKQYKIFALLFSEVLSQISLTFKNCCIPGLNSNISNNTSALIPRLVAYASPYSSKWISRVTNAGAYTYAEFQLADTRLDKRRPDTAANERQIHKTEK